MNSEYEAWNAAIAAYYFTGEVRNRPAYLSLDDDDCRTIGAFAGLTPPDAAGLAHAVRRELQTGRGRGWMFTPFTRASREWRSSGATGFPPYIALLALFVLAGTRMARDVEAGIVGHAYYARLNPLLDRPADADPARPPGFEAVQQLWADLNRWLGDDQNGALGLPTARAHGHYTNVGWPLSQCLLRAADRSRLPDFFRAVALEPGTEITDPQLLVMLRNWAHPGCGFTRQGLRVVHATQDHVGDQVATVVHQELAAWDGELRDAQGRRRGDVLLLAEKLAGGRRVTVRFVARRPDGFPETGWTTSAGLPVDVEAAGEGWFHTLPVEVTSRSLEAGFTLVSGRFALAYEPARAVPLRASLEPISGWLSARQARAVEEHLVLAHASVADDLRAFLGRYAQGEPVLTTPAGNLPAGWIIATGVRIASAVTTAPQELSRLAPRLNTATRIEGGLEVAPRQYLVGGEPDLWVTVAEGEMCDVDIDDERERLRGGVVPFRLSQFGLPPGPHRIVAGGVTRLFSSFSGFPVVHPPGVGTLGQELRKHGNYQPVSAIAHHLASGAQPRGTVRVAGALVTGAADDLPRGDRPPVLLRTGFDYMLVGARPGELLTVARPPTPEWLEAAGLADQVQYFDCPSPFTIEWAIRRGQLGISVMPMTNSPARPSGGDSLGDVAATAWAQAIGEAASATLPSGYAEAWSGYVQTARGFDASGVHT